MSVEAYTKHIPGFALVPVRGREDTRYGIDRRRYPCRRDFNADVLVTPKGKEMIEDRVIRYMVMLLAIHADAFVDHA